MNVFICNRGGVNLVKVQLEIPQGIFDRYKDMAKNQTITAKVLMERILCDGIVPLDTIREPGGDK